MQPQQAHAVRIRHKGQNSMKSTDLDADVLISGGGPCGLVLAIELGRRGIRTALFHDKGETTPHPAAGASQARTMEHYRRLGFVQRVRAAGLPPDYPTDVAYFTRFTDAELSRFQLPSSADAEKQARSLSGSWSVAELPHRCAQMYIERILRDEAEKLPSVTLHFACRVASFSEHDDHVEVGVIATSGTARTYKGKYLAGAEGARSGIRKQLDIHYQGERNTDRPFLAGQMYSTFFRSSEVYDLIPHALAWQYWAINAERRGMMLAVDGRGGFVYMTQLRPGEDPATLSDEVIKGLIHSALGRSFDLDIITRSPWTAGLMLVAERFQQGRVFLGGDAVHLFTPTGGLGYNTAVEDAVNLGWKLAARVRGWGGDALLASYEDERKPVAIRNTGYARVFAESMGRFRVPEDIEESSEAGEEARKAAGDYLLQHARSEFNIPGITLGARYDASQLIVSDGTEPPEDSASVYIPTACPGGRLPHAWLADGSSLYDALDFEFTLLQLAENETPEAILDAARRSGVPLTLLDLRQENLRHIYQADLVLVRPDQIVCWRGDTLANPAAVLALVSGNSSLQ